MSRFKKVLLAITVLVIAVIGAGYFALKSSGIISRADYDHAAPAIPDFDRPAVLVLSKANGFVHVDALPAGKAMLQKIAELQNWDIYTTENAATHNPEDLAKFDVVIWNNVSGDVLTEEQRAALKRWIEQGGGWIGIHASGGDFSYQWDWYVETLIGAQFVGHTMDPQFQDANVLVADESVGLTAHLVSPWTISEEEWYAFDRSPRHKGSEILLSVDESSYITKGKNFLFNDSMEGEHPIAWRHRIGEGRVFYSAIGHQGATYSVPEFQTLIAAAIKWAGDVK
ncbi:MAG: type 1 glutamine amidotransferase [Halieaceae bacterium]|jgi:type 1 glutamine amidotransferase